MRKYLDNLPISDIIQHTLNSHLDSQKDTDSNLSFFEQKQANKLIKQAIEQESWAKIERLNGSLITYFN